MGLIGYQSSKRASIQSRQGKEKKRKEPGREDGVERQTEEERRLLFLCYPDNV